MEFTSTGAAAVLALVIEGRTARGPDVPKDLAVDAAGDLAVDDAANLAIFAGIRWRGLDASRSLVFQAEATGVRGPAQ